ncbi:MAG: VCBS repeat-containing protein [Armatimonadetes bacterium]|nr:VCBS repeat-containing protein [Armatimonadota bacterium]
MGKRLLIFAIIFLSLLAFTIWRAQPPFRLHRKLLAKLPYEPYILLITDLDDDGHPEVTAFFWFWDKPPIWVRFPFDKPSRLRFENVPADLMVDCPFVLKALPVLTADGRLRLLRWKDGKAKLEPLPDLPDVPMEGACIGRGASMETVFLGVYRGKGKNVWLFILSPQGEWKFASRATRLRITDLADFDRDGFLDALWTGDVAWVFWGGQKGKETNLGAWMRYGSPQIADLDGDGWMEIVMVARDKRLKIWRFDRRERRLKVVAASPPLPVTDAAFSLNLFDLDGDGRKEILVADWSGNFGVFQWRDGKLKMWQGRAGLKEAGLYWEQVKFGDHLALCTYQFRTVWLFPPRIWFEGWKLRWQFREKVQFSVFCLLPKGEKALFPSNWRIQEAPFCLKFAGDIDGDGSDEVIGYDGRWRRWRLYRAEVTKAGELRWRDVLLGREGLWAFAILIDRERRGLVVAWEDGRLELLTMESRK